MIGINVVTQRSTLHGFAAAPAFPRNLSPIDFAQLSSPNLSIQIVSNLAYLDFLPPLLCLSFSRPHLGCTVRGSLL